eukprot:6466794-Amphidinium_carterae.2
MQANVSCRLWKNLANRANWPGTYCSETARQFPSDVVLALKVMMLMAWNVSGLVWSSAARGG